MRRVATCLRNERPVPDVGTLTALPDEAAWGFYAIDGLPDLEAAPPYRQIQRDRPGCSRLTSGETPDGLRGTVKEELARIERSAGELEAGWKGGRMIDVRRELSTYEVEVCDAMTARRDAAVHLRQFLADDIGLYEGGMAGVYAGLAMDMLVPAIGGDARRSLSEVMAEFEAARHRFRLALVAVALDNGMSAPQIGNAFAFSRQLASRYLKEAREKWPELAERSPGRGPVA